MRKDVAKSSTRPTETAPSLFGNDAKIAIERSLERGRRLLAASAIDSAQFQTWRNFAREVLTKVFGSTSSHVSTFWTAGWAGGGPMIIGPHAFGGGQSHPDTRRREELTQKVNVLAAIRDGADFATDIEGNDIAAKESQATSPTSREVFVVHGRDDAAKLKVARFIEQLDMRAVILHEQPNEGLTIIEKLEKHGGSVAFVIVILTPDDTGGLSGSPANPRARQNVILELGFFIGRLGRSRVCVLHTAGIELPSDMLGVVYTPLDGGWEFLVAKELRAAGFTLDMNKLFGS